MSGLFCTYCGNQSQVLPDLDWHSTTDQNGDPAYGCSDCEKRIAGDRVLAVQIISGQLRLPVTCDDPATLWKLLMLQDDNTEFHITFDKGACT